METTVPGEFAVGDVTAKLMIAHVAEAQGVIAAETIAGAPTLGVTDYTMMPLRVVATSRWPNSPSAPTEKPMADGDLTGFAKVIADRAPGAARRAPGRRRTLHGLAERMTNFSTIRGRSSRQRRPAANCGPNVTLRRIVN